MGSAVGHRFPTHRVIAPLLLQRIAQHLFLALNGTICKISHGLFKGWWRHSAWWVTTRNSALMTGSATERVV
jgi:hypothetical protein